MFAYGILFVFDIFVLVLGGLIQAIINVFAGEPLTIVPSISVHTTLIQVSVVHGRNLN